MKRLLANLQLVITPALFLISASTSASEGGKAVYQQYCAACHNAPGTTRAPTLDALQQMSAQTLRFTLTEGIMQQQGSIVPSEQFNDLIDYLAAPTDDQDWVAGMMCSPDKRAIELNGFVSQFALPGGVRHLTAEQAGLNNQDLSQLELAWAIGFPNTTSLRSAPVIVGSTLYFTPTPTGKLLAMDTESACVKWAYDAGGQLRTSISYGQVGEQQALVFAGRTGEVHAISAASGELIWKTDPRHSQRAGITGAPVFAGDRIIVPLSASGVGSGANPRYECCSEHGAVAAISADSGKLLWTYHTMEDAKYTGKLSPTGVKLRGPSGAPIWSTPTVDMKRGLVYVTTGQNTSLPATNTSDAIIALNLNTGEEQWVFQGLANDVWNLACREPWEKSGPNCPNPEDSVLKDYDFGGAAVLAKTKTGADILLAGQKSGEVWAINPDNGELIWNQRFGLGTPLGGNHWGIAIDGERVYVPINDPGFSSAESPLEPGMNALDISTGKVLWRQAAKPACDNGRKERYGVCAEKFGLSATPLAIDSAVISASIDGRVYIHEGESGNLLWQYDTLQDFKTLNGIEGKGGGIDSHSIAAGNGMIFIASGYSGFRQPPGNVLLAFKPKALP